MPSFAVVGDQPAQSSCLWRGARAQAPRNEGSPQGMLLHLTPFGGMGYTSSKRSLVDASQLLHTFPPSEAVSDRASSDPTRPVKGGWAAAWHN